MIGPIRLEPKWLEPKRLRDAGLPTIAVYILDARADAKARDRQGFTPVDCAEYWPTRAARRAPQCLAAQPVVLCHAGKRARS